MRNNFLLLVFLCLASVVSAAHAVTVQEIKSPGGITAYLAEDHSLPMISVAFAFKQGGAAYDPGQIQGLAFLTSKLLTEGAGTLDSGAFHTELDNHAIELGYTVSHDEFGGRLTTLSEFKEKAFEMLALSLASPRFDAPAIEQAKKEALAEFQLMEQDPKYLMDVAFQKAVFGDHPYGRQVQGAPEGIKQAAKNDLQRFAAEHLSRSHLLVAVSGDITAEELKTLMTIHLDVLPPGNDIPPLARPIVFADKTTPRFIAFNAPQTVINFGVDGLDRKDPQFYAYYALNHILGGNTLSSRLGENVRKTRGLAYYINTSPDQYDQAALLRGTSATRNEAVQEAIDAIKKEFAGISEHGVTEEELNKARENIIGSFAVKLDSNSDISQFLLVMLLYELGIDYMDKRNGYFEAVTLDEVNALAKTLLNPDRLLIMSIGQDVSTQAK